MGDIVIIPEDGTIGVNGVVLLNIDKKYLSWIPDNVHAFHWYSDRNAGEIEYKHHPFDECLPNKRVYELGIFSQAITTFEEETLRRTQKEIDELEAIQASRDYWKELRDTRNIKLNESDWTQLSDSPLSDEEKQSWINYRQSLRDLPESIENPEPLANDPNHPSWPSPPF